MGNACNTFGSESDFGEQLKGVRSERLVVAEDAGLCIRVGSVIGRGQHIGKSRHVLRGGDVVVLLFNLDFGFHHCLMVFNALGPPDVLELARLSFNMDSTDVGPV